MVLAFLLFSPLLQNEDLVRAIEQALTSGAPSRLAAVCARAEDAVAAQPKDKVALKGLLQLYSEADARPLAAEAAALLRELDADAAKGPCETWTFKREVDESVGSRRARVFRSEKGDVLYFIFLKDLHYSGYYRATGTVLELKVSGFGPLRAMTLLDGLDKRRIVKAIEDSEPHRKALEMCQELLEVASKSEDRGADLLGAAKSLIESLRSNAGHVGLLEELAWVYDRLGEWMAGTSSESEYRRLQSAAAARLAQQAPDLRATHRTLALLHFRLSAYALAWAEASKAEGDPLADDLRVILKKWGQCDFERVGQFDAADGFAVEVWETRSRAGGESLLFHELTYVVRRKDRPEILTYTLSSQKLKDERHYYLYSHFLGERTVLVAYADKRPAESVVREKVTNSITALSKKQPPPTKDK